jgi:hypothetical protein
VTGQRIGYVRVTIKSIINATGVVTVLAGIDLDQRLGSRAAEQLMARGETQRHSPFDYATDGDRQHWANLVAAFGVQMRLIGGPPDLAPYADALHAITAGRIGALRRILGTALMIMLEEKRTPCTPEILTLEHLQAGAGPLLTAPRDTEETRCGEGEQRRMRATQVSARPVLDGPATERTQTLRFQTAAHAPTRWKHPVRIWRACARPTSSTSTTWNGSWHAAVANRQYVRAVGGGSPPLGKAFQRQRHRRLACLRCTAGSHVTAYDHRRFMICFKHQHWIAGQTAADQRQLLDPGLLGVERLFRRAM